MQHRSEETHARILNAAETLFAKKGFDATGVADICAAAGVSKGAFYHHFPTKQAVFQALLDNWLAQLDTHLQANLEAAADVPAGLVAMASRTEHIFEGASSRAMILLEFWMQASRQPEIWKLAVAPYQRYLEVFEDIFTRGIVEGSLNRELEPRSSARLVIAIGMGLLLQSFFDPSGTNWQDVTEDGIRILMNGLVKREP